MAYNLMVPLFRCGAHEKYIKGAPGVKAMCPICHTINIQSPHSSVDDPKEVNPLSIVVVDNGKQSTPFRGDSEELRKLFDVINRHIEEMISRATEEIKQEIWIKHYCSSHKILLVGEDFLKKNYGRAMSNIQSLRSRGCRVIHNVDATKMDVDATINIQSPHSSVDDPKEVNPLSIVVVDNGKQSTPFRGDFEELKKFVDVISRPIEEIKQEIWIKHYCSSHKILLVGEGDFSFSACLGRAFGRAVNMVATSLNYQDNILSQIS
ncbi:hypothetical protein Scep_013588 [Stephania cephalantha]|uniref:25S rRNA (uridine-N(3))-methyltransferase BMT5-like domain-containing protein n=1 Tax=Stephania cephalantha TaxID=152367 RepID=A0AAP0JI39_9MAGN